MSHSVIHSGSLRVDAPPHLAFQLFTAPGEELWVEDWQPTILSGDGLRRGTVFVTDVGETTIWIVIEFDPVARHARYARVAPDSRAGTVDVRVAPDGRGASIATVTYELTGLTAAGEEMLRQIDDQAYRKMMRDWELAIAAADIDYANAFSG